MVKFDTKKMNRECRAATKSLVVGDTYFLSSFREKDGAFVKVLRKSLSENTAGWNSSVDVQVVECVNNFGGSFHDVYYAPGTIHTVNATNLYAKREHASFEAKFGGI